MMLITVENFMEKPFCDILEQLKDSNFNGCAHISSDLIRASILFENIDGVMIAEVLESVFGQLYHLKSNYNINQEKHNALIDDLVNDIQKLDYSLKNNNDIETYNTLKNIRYIATKFQVRVWHTLPETKSLTLNRSRND